MLPSFGGLRLGPPTAGLALVRGDDEDCVLSGSELRDGEIAWRLMVYVNPNSNTLPPGTGDGQRDAPENIRTENNYYDLKFIARHLSEHAISPTSRLFVVPKDRLDCIQLANSLADYRDPQLPIPDAYAFYDIATSGENWNWHEYYTANADALDPDRAQDDSQRTEDGSEYVEGMSPVSPGRSPPRLARRQPYLSRWDPGAVDEFYAERNRAAADNDPMDTVEDEPDPPNRNEWSLPLSLDVPEDAPANDITPGNRAALYPQGRYDGITVETYLQVGKNIFNKMLVDLASKEETEQPILSQLDDEPAEALIHAWLRTFVIMPSELCAVWYHAATLTVNERAALVQPPRRISNRAISFAVFAVEAMAQFVFEDRNTYAVPTALSPDQWHRESSDFWEADAKRRMSEWWTRAIGLATFRDAFDLLKNRVVKPEMDAEAQRFVDRGFYMYARLVDKHVESPEADLKTLVGETAFDTRELLALQWALFQAEADGYNHPSPLVDTATDGALRDAVTTYMRDVGPALLYPAGREGPNTTWTMVRTFTPVKWGIMTNTLRWQRTFYELNRYYQRKRADVIGPPRW